MRIRLEHNGIIFEFELEPMPEDRFRALCALAAAWVLRGIVGTVTALCGFPGLAVAAVVALFVAMIANI